MSNEQPWKEVSIDFNHKQKLQALLMLQMLGENNNEEREREWVDQYAEEVSNIINEDSPAGVKIREMASSGDYDQALIVLSRELKNRGLSQAA